MVADTVHMVQVVYHLRVHKAALITVKQIVLRQQELVYAFSYAYV